MPAYAWVHQATLPSNIPLCTAVLTLAQIVFGSFEIQVMNNIGKLDYVHPNS